MTFPSDWLPTDDPDGGEHSFFANEGFEGLDDEAPAWRTRMLIAGDPFRDWQGVDAMGDPDCGVADALPVDFAMDGALL